jgi:hypothetical protein
VQALFFWVQALFFWVQALFFWVQALFIWVQALHPYWVTKLEQISLPLQPNHFRV